MDWGTFFTSLGSSALFSGLIFLWLNHRLTNERNDLQRKHEITTEAMRTELNRVSSNQQFQFTKLHEQRAEAIKELHHKMVSIKGFAHQASHATPGSAEHIGFLEKATAIWDDFDKCYVRDMIYFSPRLCEDLLVFMDKCRWLLAHQTGEKYRPRQPLDPRDQEAMVEREKAWETLERESTDITLKIIDEFRLLLGMTPEEIRRK